MKPTIKHFALALGLALTALAGPVAAEDKWSFQVAPYLWVASVDAETSLPSSMTSGSPSSQHFETSISAGFMLAAQARYRSVGVLVDVNWLQLDTSSLDSGPLNSSVNLKSDYFYSTAALTYALPLTGKFHAEVLAGARLWNVSSDFTLNGGGQRDAESSNSQTWVDPIVGANLRYDLTRHWLLLLRGTVGGFASDDLGYDVFAGPGYQFADWCLVTLGYRFLYQEYNHNDFNLNLNAHGFLLGVAFKF